MRNSYRNFDGRNWKVNGHLEAVDINGTLQLDWILKQSGERMCIRFSGFSQDETKGGFCEHGNERSACIKSG